jgi:hypothetical protein
MGVPVVAGADPETRALMVERLGEIPFYEASHDNLLQRLEALVADPALRREWGRRGQAYVRRWHAEKKVVRQLEGLYERASAERLPVPLSVRTSEMVRRHNRVRPFELSPGIFLHMTPAMAERRGLLRAG